MKKLLVIFFAIIMVFTSSSAFAESGEAINKIADVVMMRPLGLGTLVIGSAFFVVSLPIAVISKSTKKTYKTFVKDPFNYTFTRPIGEFESGL